MVLAGDYDATALAAFTARRLEIEADEPPILKVLDSVCHNELLRAMGYDKSEFYRIGVVQRMLRHICVFASTRSAAWKSEARKETGPLLACPFSS
jgi:hypothetical protein